MTIDILRAVVRYRFLNSAHIKCLVSGSDKNLSNRLKGLFEHGYLDRPSCQYDYYRPGGGSSLAVYALGDKGAQVLRAKDGLAFGRHVSWGLKNKRAGRPFLEHTLAIADFAVALQRDVAARSDIDLLDGTALLDRLPEATQELAKPFRLSVPIIHRSRRLIVGVEPDYVFSFGFPKLKRRVNFVVEIDRGTMPVERSDLNQSSILRKVLAYTSVWRGGHHKRAFGWRNFRVLMVTPNSERAAHMRDLAMRVNGVKGSALFWFPDQETLAKHNSLDHVLD